MSNTPQQSMQSFNAMLEKRITTIEIYLQYGDDRGLIADEQNMPRTILQPRCEAFKEIKQSLDNGWL